MNRSVSQNAKPQHPVSSWPHRLAVLMVCATFPLIWVGGLVTTYDAGMAVPDWPSTYGYNLFLYPFSTWWGGPWDLFIEHGHRLLASGVGMLVIAFVVVVWRKDSRPVMRWWSLVCLALVLLQGGIGGMRVLLDAVTLARLHGCLGPVFFASCVVAAVMTSKWWRNVEPMATSETRSFQRFALTTLGIAYLQLVLGSHLRHLPESWEPSMFVVVVVAHLVVAVVLLAYCLMLAFFAVRKKQIRRTGVLTSPSLCLALLVCMQLGLGVGAWAVKYAWPQWLPGGGLWANYTVQAESMIQGLTVTGHVALGSAILATATLIAVRSSRLCYSSGTSLTTAKSRELWECVT